jgi:hypothetical protein
MAFARFRFGWRRIPAGLKTQAGHYRRLGQRLPSGKSKVDKRTVFCVFFVVLNQSDPIPKCAQAVPIPSGKETIRLVEGEQALLRTATSGPCAHNYWVSTHTDGPEAVKIRDANKNHVSLLFKNLITSKEVSCIDLGRRFFIEKPSLKIICPSGHRLAAIPGYLKVNENGIFVPQPCIPSVLVQIIRQTLDS